MFSLSLQEEGLNALTLAFPVTYIFTQIAVKNFDYAWTIWLTFVIAETVTALISIISLIISIVAYFYLPTYIPIQWNNGVVETYMDKGYIFAYPVWCAVVRISIKEIVYQKFFQYYLYGELVTDYITNYLCFIFLTIQIFVILYVYGIVKYLETLLLYNTVLLIGFLIVALARISLSKRQQ